MPGGHALAGPALREEATDGLKGLAAQGRKDEIPFMVSLLEGNNVMRKGATSNSAECSLEGVVK